ncbi:PhzF family phenazine biosynthesis protein [Parasediminibacterium sp. JCM 36343]|uniref:PhzF family phenazine biosynthesis protein n=1 Tax=Parasediminibacterium sp. JCM 36343 TaxID=3374279 RepID=UPI00397D75C5
MPYHLYQVDAFTNTIFGGNPAAVCPLQEWLPTEKMQQLANENNLSETAFFVQEGDGFYIRWFTPEFEIDLAGHPTLATAHVLFNCLGYEKDTIRFNSNSGILEVVKKEGNILEMNFPSRMPLEAVPPPELLAGFNIQPKAVYKSRDYVLVYNTQAEIANLIPNFSILNQVETMGIIVTAPGDECDFVSRFFVPNSVIGEDPVTGSAHATLIPFWAKELNKNTLVARQISKRGGLLFCEAKGDRVTIAGESVLYMKGEYRVN